MSWFFGSKGKTEQLPTMSPEQQQFFQQFLSQLGGAGGEGFGQSMEYLQRLLSGDPGTMSAFEAPHLREFEQRTLPQLAERLTGQGGGGGRASGAAHAYAQAGTNLQEKLAQLRAGLQGQAAKQLMGNYMQGAQTALGARPFGYQYTPGSPGFLGYAGQGAGGAFGSGIGGGFMDWLSNLFNQNQQY